jgi:phage terminase large subunit-like protein
MPPRKRKATEDLSLTEMADLLKVGFDRAKTNPTINNYKPHPKQIRFHSSKKQGRLYIGGNRSGKTVGGVAEDVYRLKGEHPYQRVPSPPIRGRIVTVSYTEGIEKIIKPELTKWLPPSLLINGSWEDSWTARTRTLELSNGSTCELMSYDQDLTKFAGTSRHFIHMDEEPPKDIFTENKLRILDTDGCWYITMTPVEGMTWVYDEVYIPALSGSDLIDLIVIDTEENPYLSRSALQTVMQGLDADELKARKQGKFVQLGGLAFKRFMNIPVNFDEPLAGGHILKSRIPPLNWTHYASMDHGWTNPTVWLFHAVSPSGLVITYDEIHASETVISSFAEQIHERNSREGRRVPDIYVGDPAIEQHNAQTGDSIRTSYMKEGIPILLGNNNISIGVNKMNSYLEKRKWVITEDCPNLINSLQRVRWKIFESAKKRHDNPPREELHGKFKDPADSARYFFSMQPDLYIPKEGEVGAAAKIDHAVRSALSAHTTYMGDHRFDRNLSRSLQHQTRGEWEHLDEHMGGIW